MIKQVKCHLLLHIGVAGEESGEEFLSSVIFEVLSLDGNLE